jgi:hypothetical protein
MISRLSVPVSIEVMTRIMRARSRVTRALAFTAVIVAASFTVAGPANAAYGDPVVVKFIPSANEAEFGGYWDFTIGVENTLCVLDYCQNALEVTVAGNNGFKKKFTTDVLSSEKAYISQYNVGILDAGTYTFTAVYTDKEAGELGTIPVTMSPSNQAGKLVVKPAELAVDFRIETDEHQPAGAVVNAQLTGQYVQNVEGCYGSSECHPNVTAGDWKFTISDSSGALVQEKTIAVKGADTQYASFYWHDVPYSTEYTATATFTPVSDQVKNYDIEQASELSFTSPELPVVDESDPAVVVPVTEEAETPSSVPLWLVILGLFLTVALLMASAIVFILLRRQSDPGAPDDESELVTESDNA